jgi:hypothetical protein
VFEEVSEAELFPGFVQRAGGDDETERGAPSGLGVRTQRVADAVGKRSEDERGVVGEIVR